MTHGAGLAQGQLAAVPWATLRANGGSPEKVRDQLATMLFSTDRDEIAEAYFRIENSVTAQGDLSPCAPAVVSVIMAAVAERGAHDWNLGPVLDLLCLTLAGFTARWEVELGTRGIRPACYREAMKGYWALRSIASSPTGDYGLPELAQVLVEMLDEEEAGPTPDRTG